VPRKYLKAAIYLSILFLPFFLVFIKPKTFNAVAILDAGAVPVGFAQSVAFEFKKFFYYRDTYEQYINLKKQVDLLKAKVIKQQADLQEAGRLEKIAEFRKAQSYTTVVAAVIGRDPSSWDASLILNKGNNDGIKVGMPVVAPLGVVGKIIEVGRSTSKAVLVSDPNFSVAASVARTRESGLLTGTLQGVCRLHYLTPDADVKVGDVVMTSKLSSAFPEGLIIGRIIDVQAAQSSHAVECLVAPVVELSQVEEVIIIKKSSL
jgi:rod shape-determining protein MreC